MKAPIHTVFNTHQSRYPVLLKDTIDSVVCSLDGEDQELYPYLTYLLQDLREIGSSADVVLDLVRKARLGQRSGFRVLDLGCGKGAVSIALAESFGFEIHGIDAMPDFIEEANAWAEKRGISDLCRFEAGDVRRDLFQLKGFDLVILGSIGPVLGNTEETLNRIQPCLTADSHVILDDGYIPDGCPVNPDACLSESEINRQIRNAGFFIIDKCALDSSFLRESNQEIYRAIDQRARELMAQCPDKKALFQAYLDSQVRENQILENEVMCVTWLLKQHRGK